MFLYPSCAKRVKADRKPKAKEQKADCMESQKVPYGSGKYRLQ